jgi:hypothetical protein
MGLPLFSFRLMIETQSWRFGTVPGRWEVPSYSIEGTRNGMPRMAFISFWAMRVLPLRAPHVKR